MSKQTQMTPKVKVVGCALVLTTTHGNTRDHLHGRAVCAGHTIVSRLLDYDLTNLHIGYTKENSQNLSV
jgi:hypothetical protein